MATPKAIIEFFSRSLTSFQASQDAFRVLCTLPHHQLPALAPRPPSAPPANLIVLDSSFNPPTLAHAAMARSALQATGGSKRLLLLLAVNNADKAPQPASFPVRLGMMEGFGQALLEDADAPLEIDLAVTTLPFFADKARALGQGYGAEVTQTFLAGFDTLVRIFDPKYYGEAGMRQALGPFFERARLRVTMRPDEKWGGVEEQRAYVRRLGEGGLEEVGGDAGWATRVDVVEGWGDDVSSSRVRGAVKKGEGEQARGLVGRSVWEWIEREGLYRE